MSNEHQPGSPELQPCRQCSECDGLHHWLDTCGDDDDPEPRWVCKHCDARADMCELCDDVIFPVTGATVCPECTSERGDFEP